MPRLSERWRLLAQLPTGHQTQVWVAEDLQLEEQVVLKIFPAVRRSGVRKRAITEVRLGLLLQHPNLVLLYEVLEVEQHLVAVMEFVPGGDLARVPRFENAQPPGRVV